MIRPPFGASLNRATPFCKSNNAMKSDIHPSYETIKVVCACGNSFETRSTMGEELHVEICSACHPFYTGQQKIVDTAGRVGKFQKKYGRSA